MRSLPTCCQLDLQSVCVLSPPAGPSAANNETLPTTKPGRRRRKLYKMGVTSPLLDSPLTVRKVIISKLLASFLLNKVLGFFFQSSAGAEEEKESAHVIIKRQLRSKTSRK